MDEIWRSRVPAAIEGGSYLLDPLKVMSMFVHLAKFFGAIDKVLHEEACQIIIRMPTFLYLVANVMTKQIEGKLYYIAFAKCCQLMCYAFMQPKLLRLILNRMYHLLWYYSTAYKCGLTVLRR